MLATDIPVRLKGLLSETPNQRTKQDRYPSWGRLGSDAQTIKPKREKLTKLIKSKRKI